jgi:cytochrome o ubiquinol oxidase subunit 2
MNQTHELSFEFNKIKADVHGLLSQSFKILTMSAVALLGGCSDMVLFDPKGPIGDTERFVITASFILMLIVVIPVIVMALWFTWRYRESSTGDHDYAPKWSYSGKIELAIWVIPLIIVTALGTLIWTSTYRLDPHNPIDSTAEPVNIEVVSLDWKWLFIYPDEDIAIVNQLVFPVGVPLNFRITSDTVMTSFFIPQLGSQIYAMAGMQTRLHLLADEPGTYFGQNQQFSGSGYAHMNFKAIAVPAEEFAARLATLRQSPEKLDRMRYEKLLKPTSGYPVTPFSSVTPGLFDYIIGKYSNPKDHPGPMHEKYGFVPLPAARPEVD